MATNDRTKKLISVCWLLTSMCNYGCKFCFKVSGENDISQMQAHKILLQLKWTGVKKISFSGGEPLLWSGNLFELIRRTKRLGIETMIITNGSLLTSKVLHKMDGILDWITLPLDGSSEENQVNAGRPSGHFTHTVSLLRLLRNSPFKIKINTVLSQQNLNDVRQIGQIVESASIIRRWKVFQFYSVRDASRANRDKFEITNAEFENARRIIVPIFNYKSCKVYFSSNRDLETSYFTIDPEGNAFVTQDGKDIIIGNVIKTNVAQIWRQTKLINKSKYLKRASWFLEG
jgi:radical S-adenosyl methionine domain-containing protein 2